MNQDYTKKDQASDRAQSDRIEEQTRRARPYEGSGYSTRELDIIFQDIKDTLTEFKTETKASLGEIKAQVTKTNGSVSNLKIWRGYITGGLAILTIIVLPIMAYLALQEINTSETLASFINSAKISASVFSK